LFIKDAEIDKLTPALVKEEFVDSN